MSLRLALTPALSPRRGGVTRRACGNRRPQALARLSSEEAAPRQVKPRRLGLGMEDSLGRRGRTARRSLTLALT
jgi:hypothetical protein